MANPIVIGVALRDDDNAPLALGRDLARFTGAPLAIAHVFPYDPSAPASSPADAAVLEGDAILAIATTAETLGDQLEVTLHAEPNTSRVRGLRAAAEQLDASLLVVGASHRGRLGRLVPGGVAERLLHTAPCALAVAPRDYSGSKSRIARIGVAFVDTAEGREALAAAAAMAVLGGATLSIYTVLQPPAAVPAVATPGLMPPAVSDSERRARARAVVDRAAAGVPAAVLAEVELLDGDVGPALAAASAELDLLVCGSRGFGRLIGALVGGVSGTLAHSCACPLIVLPRERHGIHRRSRDRLAEDSQARPELGAGHAHGA